MIDVVVFRITVLRIWNNGCDQNINQRIIHIIIY